MARDGTSPESAYPLREVAQKIAGWVGRLGQVWVEGQVIEINQSKGWVYLSLRDTLAEMSIQVTCSQLTFTAGDPITQGATVTVLAKPTFTTKSGRLALTASDIRASGEGRLLAQLEQRKRMLQAEGLFEPTRKKRLPFLPTAIGLITGAGSKAEQDVLENVLARWPAARIVTRYALVQGPNSAADVMAALHELDGRPEVEVIIVARGGGSVEDLLPFSDEGVVRAAAACHTPVVSAIGHEPDTPLLDYVADLRASTPTDAAKRVVPDAREEATRVTQARARVRQAVVARVAHEQQSLDALRSRPVLREPTASIEAHRERVAALAHRANRAMDVLLAAEARAVESDRRRVVAMSPKATLQRGYAILAQGRDAVASVADAAPGDELRAILVDGELALTVDAVHPGRPAAPSTEEDHG